MTAHGCAAKEALERIANVGDHGLRIGAERDALRYAEKEARAVLASPCCVSADQEQVKEALRRIVGDSYNLLTQGESPTQRRGPSAQRIYDEARAALALLGSQEEEERHG